MNTAFLDRFNILGTLKRFPLAFVAALVGTVTAIIIIGEGYSSLPVEEIVTRILMAAIFAFPLSVSSVLHAEEKNYSIHKKTLIQLAVLLLAAAFYFLVMRATTSQVDNVRAVVLIAASFLSVFVLPFIPHTGKNDALWSFCKFFLARLALTAVYMGTLFIGIAIILQSISYLFDFQFADELYPQIWVFLAGIVAQLFFLSGFPQKVSALSQGEPLNKYARIFITTLLIPLTFVYGLILYVYGGKMLAQWDLPQGGVAYLVMVFAFVGFVTYAISLPLWKERGNRLATIYAQGLPYFLLPLCVLLFVSIGRRIGDYGVTENRYFVLVFGLWILGLILYFVASKKKYIGVIFTSLLVLLVVSLFGPWSAFSISKSSQLDRLRELLVKNNILIENKVHTLADAKAISAEDIYEINSVLGYFESSHGFNTKTFRAWFGEDFLKEKDGYDQYSRLQKTIGIQDIPGADPREEWVAFYLNKPQEVGVPLDGYNFFLPEVTPRSMPMSFSYKGKSYRLSASSETEIVLEEGGRRLAVFNLLEILQDLKKAHPAGGKISVADLTREVTGNGVKMTFSFDNIQALREGDSFENISFTTFVALDL